METDQQIPVALIYSAANSIGQSVATTLQHKGIQVALYDPDNPEPIEQVISRLPQPGLALNVADCKPGEKVTDSQVFEAVSKQAGCLDFLINLCPIDNPQWREWVPGYELKLYERNLSAGKIISKASDAGRIINLFFLATLFENADIRGHISIARAGIQGLTRHLAVTFGSANLCINSIQVGMLNCPELEHLYHAAISEVQELEAFTVLPQDIADCMAFLALEGSYITGRTMIMDRGLTTGLTGV